MKQFKTLVALVLAMALTMTLVGSAFAATISIARDSSYDGTGGRTYEAYKVFDADTALSGTDGQTALSVSYTTTGPIAYSMATDSPWVAVLWDTTNNQATQGQIWFNVALAADGSKYVVTPVGTLTDANAVAIATWLKNHIPNNAAHSTITPDTPLTGAANGYYLIVPSDGATNLTLVTADVTITEKNTYITTDKDSVETDYYVGQEITYTATVKIPADTNPANPVILHDTMDTVLAFQNNVTATIKTIGAEGAGTSFDGFTVEADADDITDNCTFEISIPVNENTLGKEITFTYTAEITSVAATETGLVNTLFGSHGTYETNPTTVYDYTHEFPFTKVFANSDSTDLTAHFELRTDADDDSTAIAFNAKTNHAQTKVDTDDGAGSTDIVIVNNETITLKGLDSGEYYLVETATSTGYNLLDGPVKVTIEDTTTDPAHPSCNVTYEFKGQTASSTITNNQGSVLPSTGGMGTTIIYVVGAVLVLGAAAVILARRKAEQQ